MECNEYIDDHDIDDEKLEDANDDNFDDQNDFFSGMKSLQNSSIL